MKKLIAIIALLGASLASYGASTTINTPAGVTPTILVSNSCRSVQFIISNTNLIANAYHTFFDAPAVTTTTTPATAGAAITNVLASYTYVSLTFSHITNVYTYYTGVAQTTNVQYDAWTHTTNTVAQTTNGYPALLTLVVPTNSTLTIDFNQRWINGILNTNSGAGSVTTVFTQ